MRSFQSFLTRLLCGVWLAAGIAATAGCGGREGASAPQAPSVSGLSALPRVSQYKINPNLVIISDHRPPSDTLAPSADALSKVRLPVKSSHGGGGGGANTGCGYGTGCASGDPVYGGGALLKNANVVVIGLNKPPVGYYGDPCLFLTRLDLSPITHILDQYVNATGNGRYPCAGSFEVDGVPNISDYSTTSADTMLANLLVPYLTGNNDMGAMYDIFVPGASVDAEGDCGFHGMLTVQEGGIQHQIVYSVNASCPGDGYANVVEHENFESASDPDPPSGWITPDGQWEIADLCYLVLESYTMFDNSQYPTLQPMWSNASKSCTMTP